MKDVCASVVIWSALPLVQQYRLSWIHCIATLSDHINNPAAEGGRKNEVKYWPQGGGRAPPPHAFVEISFERIRIVETLTLPRFCSGFPIPCIGKPWCRKPWCLKTLELGTLAPGNLGAWEYLEDFSPRTDLAESPELEILELEISLEDFLLKCNLVSFQAPKFSKIRYIPYRSNPHSTPPPC